MFLKFKMFREKKKKVASLKECQRKLDDAIETLSDISFFVQSDEKLKNHLTQQLPEFAEKAIFQTENFKSHLQESIHNYVNNEVAKKLKAATNVEN
jgi:hypothetical protein